MRVLISTILLSMSFQTTAQDTIVHKSGKIEAVQVLNLDKGLKLMVYAIADDTIYMSTDNFEKYMIHSPSVKFKIEEKPLTVESSEEKQFENVAKRFPRYEYGKFSIGTNLFALMQFSGRNTRMTIEPEFTLSKKFSLKIPLTIGLSGFDEAYYKDGQTHGANNQYAIYNSIEYDGVLPDIQEYYLWRNYEENTIGEIGIQPKFYFYDKHRHPLSLYALAGFNIGIATYYQYDRYHSFDTTGYQYQDWNGSDWDVLWRTNWDIKEPIRARTAYNSVYYSFDLALGLDFNFSRSICIGLQAGYASQAIPFIKKNDHIYRNVFGGEYETYLDYSPVVRSWGESIRMKFHLIYRFGGKRIEE